MCESMKFEIMEKKQFEYNIYIYKYETCSLASYVSMLQYEQYEARSQVKSDAHAPFVGN